MKIVREVALVYLGSSSGDYVDESDQLPLE